MKAAKEYDLVLVTKGKWFDMLDTGEKRDEYRDIKPYYETRIRNMFVKQIMKEVSCDKTTALEWANKRIAYLKSTPVSYSSYKVLHRRGYVKNVPTLLLQCSISCGYGNEEWGADPEKFVFIFHTETVLSNSKKQMRTIRD